MVFSCILGAGFANNVAENVTTSDGRERTCFLHTPPGYDGKTPLPLLMALHFAGINQGQNMASVTGLSVKADEEGFIAAYPNAIGQGWTDYDALFIDELVDTLKARYAVDERRVFMTGWSAGAFMTYWMACKLSEEVAAFAPVAGSMLTYDWSGCYPTRPPSIVSFNARDDPMMPYYGDGGYIKPVEETMSDWAERLECDKGPDSFYNATGALRQTWSRTDGACEVVLWTTELGGHGWPFEESAHKLSANDVMWDFFCAHPLPEEEPGLTEGRITPSNVLETDAANLFLRSATIRFTLAEREDVKLKVYDALGRKVVTLIDGVLDEGEHSIVLDAGGLHAGVYFCILETPTFTNTSLIRLIK